MVKLTTKAYVLAATCFVLATGIYFYQDNSVDYFYLTLQRPVYFSQNDPVAYYYLTLQWPASVCQLSKVKCSKVPGNFPIHGLWAQAEDHNPYSCSTNRRNKRICRKHTFSYKKLKKDKVLMNMMKKSWPNLFESSQPDPNQKFWRHEWKKHGCCIFKSQQNKYFKKTCGMYRKQPSLLEIFKAKNITPGVHKTYLLKDYIEAIEDELHVKPGAFKCKEDKKGNKRLVEVKLCTDKVVTKFENCNATEETDPSCATCPSVGPRAKKEDVCISFSTVFISRTACRRFFNPPTFT